MGAKVSKAIDGFQNTHKKTTKQKNCEDCIVIGVHKKYMYIKFKC